MDTAARWVVITRWFEHNRDLKAADIVMVDRDGEKIVPLFTNKANAKAGQEALQVDRTEQLEAWYVSTPEYLSSMLAELGQPPFNAAGVIVDGIDRVSIHGAVLALETAW